MRIGVLIPTRGAVMESARRPPVETCWTMARRADQAGYGTMHTDWRVANLESSRFWPRRGFRETFYRVARRVNIG